MKITVAVLVLAVLVFSACVSETKETGALSWTDRAGMAPENGQPRSGQPAQDRPRTREPDPDRVVQVPESVVAELMTFVNSPKVLMADRIEIDASRIPFQMAMVPLADPGYVDKVQMGSRGANATGILLRTKNPVPQMERDFPRLRVGDGIDILATREIQARTYNAVDENRPMFIQVQGIGNASYRDPKTGQRLERDAITLIAEVVPGPGGLVFRQRVQ